MRQLDLFRTADASDASLRVDPSAATRYRVCTYFLGSDVPEAVEFSRLTHAVAWLEGKLPRGTRAAELERRHGAGCRWVRLAYRIPGRPLVKVREW